MIGAFEKGCAIASQNDWIFAGKENTGYAELVALTTVKPSSIG